VINLEKEKSVHWNVPAPKPLDEALEKFVTSDFHMTKAEFIRDAVREKLAKHGVTHETLSMRASKGHDKQ